MLYRFFTWWVSLATGTYFTSYHTRTVSAPPAMIALAANVGIVQFPLVCKFEGSIPSRSHQIDHYYIGHLLHLLVILCSVSGNIMVHNNTCLSSLSVCRLLWQWYSNATKTNGLVIENVNLLTMARHPIQHCKNWTRFATNAQQIYVCLSDALVSLCQLTYVQTLVRDYHGVRSKQRWSNAE